MKKILCVFLSLVMLLSVTTVAFAAEDEEKKDFSEVLAEKNIDEAFINAFNGKTLDIPSDLKKSDGTYNVAEIISNSSNLSRIEFLGLKLSEVYKETDEPLDWGQMSVSHNDVGNLWGEMNTFIASYLTANYLQDDKLCTAKNATGIANVIGHMLTAGYQDKTINYSTSYVLRKTFFQDISDTSGLTDAIINGWLTVKTVNGKATYAPKDNVNYHPLLIRVFGVPIYNTDGSGGSMELFDYFTTPSQEYLNPTELGGYIVKSVVENAISEGPIQYLLSVLKHFVDEYTLDLHNPVSALLSSKINAGYVTKEQLRKQDLSVLLNTLFNDNKVSNTSRMQFVPFPYYRFRNTTDTTNHFLYLMIYTNLLGKHLKNQTSVNKLKQSIDGNSALNASDKKYTKIMVDAMFSGDLTGLANNMQDISKENFDRVPNTWGWNFLNFFARFWKTIASFFDGIFKTLKNGINLDMFD